MNDKIKLLLEETVTDFIHREHKTVKNAYVGENGITVAIETQWVTDEFLQKFKEKFMMDTIRIGVKDDLIQIIGIW